MEFLQFAKACGVLIDHFPPIGVWRRFPTESHPHKKNGAVKYMGDHAFICDWAVGDDVHVWKADASVKIDHEKSRRLAQEAKRKIEQGQQEAAKKAAWMLHQCQIAHHPYLEKKGFKDEQGNVYKTDNGLVLVIPMRVGHRLVGCQSIAEDGTKKFLYGQRTSEASFVFDNSGPNILCEGYATALSVRAALKALRRRYTLHVCFSAGNLVKVAATLPGGFVVADHDTVNKQTGTRAGHEVVRQIGWPHWMPDTEGMDANDTHQRDGLFKFSQSLLKAMK